MTIDAVVTMKSSVEVSTRHREMIEKRARFLAREIAAESALINARGVVPWTNDIMPEDIIRNLRDSQPCIWTVDEDGVWWASCGYVFVTSDGASPVTHGFVYCPFCGARLTVAAEQSPITVKER